MNYFAAFLFLLMGAYNAHALHASYDSKHVVVIAATVGVCASLVTVYTLVFGKLEKPDYQELIGTDLSIPGFASASVIGIDDDQVILSLVHRSGDSVIERMPAAAAEKLKIQKSPETVKHA